MYKVEELELTEQVLRIADSYGIPREQVVTARHEECGAGYGGTVFVTRDGMERRSGCGHPMCTQCKWGHGGIGIGDEAFVDFAPDEEVEAFARRQVEWSIEQYGYYFSPLPYQQKRAAFMRGYAAAIQA